MEHLRVNIGHFSNECFCHFDNEHKMFQWISKRVGCPINSYADCESWTRKQDDEHGLYIEILHFNDVKDFYRKRREYIGLIDRCNTYLEKAQQASSHCKRSYYLNIFGENYDFANHLAEEYPIVWQGEV